MVLWQHILNAWGELYLLDFINLILGLTSVWLLVCRNVLGFLVGILASLGQAVLFYQQSFYASVILQLFYIGIFAWGWYHWKNTDAEKNELPITRLSTRGWLVLLLISGVAMTAWAFVAMKWIATPMPWNDGFIAAFGGAGQVLQARKQLDNWPLWIVVDGVAGISYWCAGMQFTGILYFIFLGMAVAGWWSWMNEWRAQKV